MNIAVRVLQSALGLICMGGAALADPLTDMVNGRAGGICYDRVYSAEHLAQNPYQLTRQIRMSLNQSADFSTAIVRVRIVDEQGPVYVLGRCKWSPDAGRAASESIPTFKGGAGLDCTATTTDNSWEPDNGGDFVVDMRDGRSMTLHMPTQIAARADMQTLGAGFYPLEEEDRIFRVNGTGTETCADMDGGLAYY